MWRRPILRSPYTGLFMPRSFRWKQPFIRCPITPCNGVPSVPLNQILRNVSLSICAPQWHCICGWLVSWVLCSHSTPKCTDSVNDSLGGSRYLGSEQQTFTSECSASKSLWKSFTLWIVASFKESILWAISCGVLQHFTRKSFLTPSAILATLTRYTITRSLSLAWSKEIPLERNPMC